MYPLQIFVITSITAMTLIVLIPQRQGLMNKEISVLSIQQIHCKYQGHLIGRICYLPPESSERQFRVLLDGVCSSFWWRCIMCGHINIRVWCLHIHVCCLLLKYLCMMCVTAGSDVCTLARAKNTHRVHIVYTALVGVLIYYTQCIVTCNFLISVTTNFCIYP